VNGQMLPDQYWAPVPVLQAQDGSYVGTASVMTDPTGSPTPYMVAFDQSGSLRWSVAGNYQPQIATEDGGVIATDDSGAAVTFDQNGNGTGQITNLVRSWTGAWYRYGSVEQVFVAVLPYVLAASFWACEGANASENDTAAEPLPDRVIAAFDGVGTDPLGGGAVVRNITYTLYQGMHLIPPVNGAVISERLLYSYGQKPEPSSSNPGKQFDDQIGTRGKGDFGLTQQFFGRLPETRDIRLQIVPCIGTNKVGDPTWQNIIKATSQQVLINGDEGSTQGRTCRQ